MYDLSIDLSLTSSDVTFGVFRSILSGISFDVQFT